MKSGIEEGERKSKRKRNDKFKTRQWEMGKGKDDEWDKERGRYLKRENEKRERKRGKMREWEGGSKREGDS